MDKARIKNIIREVLKEIKVNNPNKIKFPIEIYDKEQALKIGKQLKSLGYKMEDGLSGKEINLRYYPFGENAEQFDPFKLFQHKNKLDSKIIDYEYISND